MKQGVRLFFLCLTLVSLTAPYAASAKVPAILKPRVTWSRLADGLWLAEHPLARIEPASPLDQDYPLLDRMAGLKDEESPQLVMLRVDPARYDFTLHMASGEKARSLPDLARRHKLVAAINAGMYLPDKVTSTGHMRNATHTNNPRIVSRFGAFFLAGPKVRSLPRAVLLDRDAHEWKTALPRYSLAIQNFRLSDQAGSVLWPDGPEEHSIAAMAQDKAGNIVLLFCAKPVKPADFARRVLALDLSLGTIMYLEGGSPAAMLVRQGDTEQVHVGRRGLGLLEKRGDPQAAIPNVLGIRPRQESTPKR